MAANQSEPPYEIMVIITNPEDFASWPADQKKDRHKRVLDWHQFVRANNPGKITQAWGTHQILSQNGLSNINNMHLAVYNVPDLREYDRLMVEDPLRDVSRYGTFFLQSLKGDHAKDFERTNKLRDHLFKENAALRTDPDSEYAKLRQLYTQAPDFVGNYTPRDPPNEIMDFNSRTLDTAKKEDESTNVLIIETNTDESQSHDDGRKLILYEKILWWADYASMLIGKGQITHGWTQHNFCDAEDYASGREGAVVVHRTDTWEEFDKLYADNPIRTHGKFWSIVLQPLELQYELDKRRAEIAGVQT